MKIIIIIFQTYNINACIAYKILLRILITVVFT